MKARFLLLLGAAMATAGSAAAQTSTPSPAAIAPATPCASFSGRITASSKPLSGVSVFVKGTNIILITNEEGFFALPPKITQLPTLSLSAAGYAPQELALTSCAPVEVEMQMLPGTRIKQHGKRKGFIMKTGQ